MIEFKIKNVKLDTSELKNLFSKRRAMKGVKVKDSVWKEEVLLVKNEIKEYGYMVYELHFYYKGLVKIEAFESYPSQEDIKRMYTEFKSSIKENRKRRKELVSVTKTKGMYTYKLIGGTFFDTNSIITLDNSVNKMQILRTKKDPVTVDNYVGIELELICKLNQEQLGVALIESKLHKHVQIKTDSSINREEDKEYTHELAILVTERELESVVSKVCSILNTDKVGGYVNNSCGMHMHFDMRNRDVGLSYNNLIKGLPLLTNIVPNDRLTSTYCKINSQTLWADGGSRGDRYQAINPQAYSKYKTLEIRLHSGTINKTKIINWFKICLTIMNSGKHIIRPYDLNGLCEQSVLDYAQKRYDKFTSPVAKKAYDTRTDHFFNDVA